MSGRRSARARRWCAIIDTVPFIYSARSVRPAPSAPPIIMPVVNTEAMNDHLKEISVQVAPGAHALLICDGAGWHQPGKRLDVPDNITLMALPPYAPELNPMENVWDYLRGNKLSSVWSGTVTTPSSTPAKTHGIFSPMIRSGSFPSERRSWVT